MAKIGKELGPRRELFCKEFLVDLNASQAAKRAGYARIEEGHRLLADEGVQARIVELQAERNTRLQVEADEALRRLLEIMRMNPDAVEKLKYSDVVKCIELVLRHTGQLQPDTAVAVQVNVGDVGMAERIIRARRRVGLYEQEGGE